MIINLTQHPSTADQRAAGVVDLQNQELAALKELLTFNDLPSREDIATRAEQIAGLAVLNGLGGEDEDPVPLQAMIGGAPYLMAPLEWALQNQGITPVYAFSLRETVEQPQPDGSVKKTQVFKHLGFVKA